MVPTLWVRLRQDKEMSWHPLRFDDPTATVCGFEVDDDDEIKDEISVTDKTCENCFKDRAVREQKSE